MRSSAKSALIPPCGDESLDARFDRLVRLSTATARCRRWPRSRRQSATEPGHWERCQRANRMPVGRALPDHHRRATSITLTESELALAVGRSPPARLEVGRMQARCDLGDPRPWAKSTTETVPLDATPRRRPVQACRGSPRAHCPPDASPIRNERHRFVSVSFTRPIVRNTDRDSCTIVPALRSTAACCCATNRHRLSSRPATGRFPPREGSLSHPGRAG